MNNRPIWLRIRRLFVRIMPGACAEQQAIRARTLLKTDRWQDRMPRIAYPGSHTQETLSKSVLGILSKPKWDDDFKTTQPLILPSWPGHVQPSQSTISSRLRQPDFFLAPKSQIQRLDHKLPNLWLFAGSWTSDVENFYTVI